jgi:hypothetical protein
VRKGEWNRKCGSDWMIIWHIETDGILCGPIQTKLGGNSRPLFSILNQKEMSELNFFSFHHLNQGLLETLPFSVSQTSNCNFPYTYTHSFLKAGLTVAQPSWISYSTINQNFSATITAPADIGVYTIT